MTKGPASREVGLSFLGLGDTKRLATRLSWSEVAMLRSLVLVSLSLLTLVTASRADAKCMSTAEWLVTEQVAGPTPSIVVAVYAMSKTRPTITFELVGPKGERIALRETARHSGWRTDHVVYVPTKPLTPGTYDVRGGRDALALQVVPASDTPLTAPTLKVLPAEIQQFGCGPAENLRLAVSGDATLAFVTLRDDGGVTTGYATIDDERVLAIGHGMCAGMWFPEVGKRYTIEVQLVDPSGKLSPPTKVQASFDPK